MRFRAFCINGCRNVDLFTVGYHLVSFANRSFVARCHRDSIPRSL
ncbi:hypothetical protein X946_5468 [Burkholderia sp. ABCPW 111]|nr:hypothetical protein X946_5468 [Burkholderia sp. ABCPW 111]